MRMFVYIECNNSKLIIQVL